MSEFTIYPAVDLRGGRVVRLSQGDPNRETEYNSDPAAAAQQWLDAGAAWLHVVNLDGAFGESGAANLDALQAILTIGNKVQFGGGLRSLDAIERVLKLGVSRVVLGTVAVEQPDMVSLAVAQFGAERVAVGIDARDGFVRTRGWQHGTGLTARQLAVQWADMGGKWLIFTDVSRDGMGSGVNVNATADLATTTGLSVIASGGVGKLADVKRVRDAGLTGVIIGRALYEGQVQLGDALALAGG